MRCGATANATTNTHTFAVCPQVTIRCRPVIRRALFAGVEDTRSSIGLCSQRRNNFSKILLAFGRSRLPLRYCDTQLSDGVIELIPPLRSGPRCRWKCHPTPAYASRNEVGRVLESPCRSVRIFGFCPDDVF